jgi:hypothetical protein
MPYKVCCIRGTGLRPGSREANLSVSVASEQNRKTSVRAAVL